MTRSRLAATLGLAVLLAVGFFVYRDLTPTVTAIPPSPSPSSRPSAITSASPSPSTSTPASAAPSPKPSPAASPSPSATPGPALVPGPLDGLPVSAADARRQAIAVMIDDLGPARPQSGFSAASVVWQAPAEGGIPRYMLIVQSRTPTDVGPVRSARYYYIAWAAEWRALYAHSGGSPQALAALRAQGNGQLVYNGDEFRWGGSFRRVANRFAPHNLYTTGKQLRSLAKAVGAKDGRIQPAWQFAPDAPIGERPKGGSIRTAYPDNAIKYAYDRFTNTYVRSVTGEKVQHDAATGKAVAPKNVVIMLMHFGPLNDSNPAKRRLEADVVGQGTAWIATNGITVKGTWRKASLTAPTLFYGPDGRQVTFTAGQTFINVMQQGLAHVTVVPGVTVSAPGRPTGVPLQR